MATRFYFGWFISVAVGAGGSVELPWLTGVGCTSKKSCGQLGWADSIRFSGLGAYNGGIGVPGVCGFAVKCLGLVTQAVHTNTCVEAGARACTAPEMTALEAAGRGCPSYDLHPVFTSTSCNGGNIAVSVGKDGATPVSTCIPSGKLAYGGRCCADVVPKNICAEVVTTTLPIQPTLKPTARPTVPPTPSPTLPSTFAPTVPPTVPPTVRPTGPPTPHPTATPAPTPVCTSLQSCGELGWSDKIQDSGKGNYRGGDGIVGVCGSAVSCLGKVHHAEHKLACEGVGARMCTASEMLALEAGGRGCQSPWDYDLEYVFTSTPCTNGFMAVRVGRFGMVPMSKCVADDLSAYGGRCCADGLTGYPCSPLAHSNTETLKKKLGNLPSTTISAPQLHAPDSTSHVPLPGTEEEQQECGDDPECQSCCTKFCKNDRASPCYSSCKVDPSTYMCKVHATELGAPASTTVLKTPSSGSCNFSHMPGVELFHLVFSEIDVSANDMLDGSEIRSFGVEITRQEMKAMNKLRQVHHIQKHRHPEGPGCTLSQADIQKAARWATEHPPPPTLAPTRPPPPTPAPTSSVTAAIKESEMHTSHESGEQVKDKAREKKEADEKKPTAAPDVSAWRNHSENHGKNAGSTEKEKVEAEKPKAATEEKEEEENEEEEASVPTPRTAKTEMRDHGDCAENERLGKEIAHQEKEIERLLQQLTDACPIGSASSVHVSADESSDLKDHRGDLTEETSSTGEPAIVDIAETVLDDPKQKAQLGHEMVLLLAVGCVMLFAIGGVAWYAARPSSDLDIFKDHDHEAQPFPLD